MVEETDGTTDCATTDRSAPRFGVTVIIPAFNEGPIIEDCLRGVINQTSCRALEIIVVAKGCADDTALIELHSS